jgi:hypothetical protein
MKGTFRLLIGFLIAAGAVGTLDINPDADLLTQAALAFFGLAIAAWGVSAIKKETSVHGR